MNYTLLSDERLAQFLYAEDTSAFKEIYNRYWQKLYQVALAKTHVQQVAEELLQTLFISVWEKRKVTPIAHLEPYLMRAIKFKIINHIQSFHTKQKCLRMMNNQITRADDSDTQTMLQELHVAINTAIEKLPQKTKFIFRLSREENYSAKEIAQQMNLSPKAVEYHITQSLKLMRLHLKNFIVPGTLLFFSKYFKEIYFCFRVWVLLPDCIHR